LPLIRSLRPQCNREEETGAHSGDLLEGKSLQLPEADKVAQNATHQRSSSEFSHNQDPQETWAAQDFRSAKSFLRSFAKA
jgi:hypothetical protein